MFPTTPFLEALQDAPAWKSVGVHKRRSMRLVHPAGCRIKVDWDDAAWRISEHVPTSGTSILGYRFIVSIPKTTDTGRVAFKDDLDRVFGAQAQKALHHLARGIWTWGLSTHDLSLHAELTLMRKAGLVVIRDMRRTIPLPDVLRAEIDSMKAVLGVSRHHIHGGIGLGTATITLVAPHTMHERMRLMAPMA